MNEFGIVLEASNTMNTILGYLRILYMQLKKAVMHFNLLEYYYGETTRTIHHIPMLL